jgi:hypothetical protein
MSTSRVGDPFTLSMIAVCICLHVAANVVSEKGTVYMCIMCRDACRNA